jgi:cation diffusion facilitator CzcD-associated flavoprotein CzcO
MTVNPTQPDATSAGSEHADVLIIGAGISGIDAAYHLRKERPEASFAILDGKPDLGGTWHTHRFPGIRSDSDLFTFGFSWKPWTGVPIATADEILRYLIAAVDENNLRAHIRFGHEVVRADWSSARQLWTVTVRNVETSRTKTITCAVLWMCAGYYRHAEGYTPHWPGMDSFKGVIAHPQTWPEGLDHTDKRVVVIGSGATAATIVPKVSETAAHVIMLQRSPTYYYPRPVMDEFNATLNALDLPPEWVHEIMRRKFLHESQITVERSRTEPDALAADMINGAREYLGEGYDVATHFTPTYRPWRQRVAMVPDGDLFVAIREGRAEVVTDSIDRFTPTGLALQSGRTLDADIIVTATGLTLTMFGDIVISVDGRAVDPAECVTHRGIMFSDIPNFFNVFGYLRTSWTMRADLVSAYVIRMLAHMDAIGAGSVTPRLRAEDADMQIRPWIDPDNFNAGYIMRSLPALPRQGDRQPWIMTQDYYRDRDDLPSADLEDGTLIYDRAVQNAPAQVAE